MSMFSRSVEDVAAERFRKAPVKLLVRTVFSRRSPGLEAEFLAAVREIFPDSTAYLFLLDFERIGARLAYGVVRCYLETESLQILASASAAADRMQSMCHCNGESYYETIFQSFTDRLLAYRLALFAGRYLLVDKPWCGHVRGLIIERLAVAAAVETPLLERLLQEIGKDRPRTHVQRTFDRSLQEARGNTFTVEPVVRADEFYDLLNALRSARPAQLALMLEQLRPCCFGVVQPLCQLDDDSEAALPAPLLENRYFAEALDGLPDTLAEAGFF
jgi:hypothetical protein